MGREIDRSGARVQKRKWSRGSRVRLAPFPSDHTKKILRGRGRSETPDHMHTQTENMYAYVFMCTYDS